MVILVCRLEFVIYSFRILSLYGILVVFCINIVKKFFKVECNIKILFYDLLEYFF